MSEWEESFVQKAKAQYEVRSTVQNC